MYQNQSGLYTEAYTRVLWAEQHGYNELNNTTVQKPGLTWTPMSYCLCGQTQCVGAVYNRGIIQADTSTLLDLQFLELSVARQWDMMDRVLFCLEQVFVKLSQLAVVKIICQWIFSLEEAGLPVPKEETRTTARDFQAPAGCRDNFRDCGWLSWYIFLKCSWVLYTNN